MTRILPILIKGVNEKIPHLLHWIRAAHLVIRECVDLFQPSPQLDRRQNGEEGRPEQGVGITQPEADPELFLFQERGRATVASSSDTSDMLKRRQSKWRSNCI